MRVFYGMLGVFVFLSCTLSVRASDDYYTNLKKDANSGNALAQYKLGAMYLVVSGDYKKAFYWTNKSAIQGNSDAQNNLGLLYYYGQGVDKNIKKVETDLSSLKKHNVSGFFRFAREPIKATLFLPNKKYLDV